MGSQDAQNLAERIALMIQGNEREGDDFLRLTLEKINQRLDKIETSIFTPDSRLQTPDSRFKNHSSQEKFTALEELADEIINGLQNEKACPYEPTGKPCDHCAMCNSRGF